MITGLRIVVDNDGLGKVRPMGFDIIRKRSASGFSINDLSIGDSGDWQG